MCLCGIGIKGDASVSTETSGTTVWVRWQDVEIDEVANMLTTVSFEDRDGKLTTLRIVNASWKMIDGSLQLVKGKLECVVEGKIVASNISELSWSSATKKKKDGREKKKQDVDDEEREKREAIWVTSKTGTKKTKIRLSRPDGDEETAMRDRLRADIGVLTTTAKVKQRGQVIPPPNTFTMDISPSTTVIDLKVKADTEVPGLKPTTQRLIHGMKDAAGVVVRNKDPSDASKDVDDYTTMKDLQVQDGDTFEVIRRSWSEMHAIKVQEALLDKELRKLFPTTVTTQGRQSSKAAPTITFDDAKAAFHARRAKYDPNLVPLGKVGWQPESVGWEPDATLVLMSTLLQMKPPPVAEDTTQGGELSDEDADGEDADGEDAEKESTEESTEDAANQFDSLFADKKEKKIRLDDSILNVQDNEFVDALNKRREKQKSRMRSRWMAGPSQGDSILKGNPIIKWIQSGENRTTCPLARLYSWLPLTLCCCITRLETLARSSTDARYGNAVQTRNWAQVSWHWLPR